MTKTAFLRFQQPCSKRKTHEPKMKLWHGAAPGREQHLKGSVSLGLYAQLKTERAHTMCIYFFFETASPVE